MTTVTDPEGYEERILHQFVSFRGKDVLEVGCGDGRLTWKYVDSARSVSGFDIELEDLQYALADMPADVEHKILFAQASALAIPHARNTFDIAILAWSL